MPEQYAAPIDHTMGSAMATTAGGALKGAVKTGFKASAAWTIGFTVLGAVALAAVPYFLGAGLVMGLAAAGTGAVAGGFLGLSTSPFAGVIGSAVGSVFGAFRGHTQVNNERASAAVLQAQVEAYKAQVAAQAPTTNIYAPTAVNDNKYSFPAQGTSMNQAASGIQAGDAAQYQGTVAGQQLAAAR